MIDRLFCREETRLQSVADFLSDTAIYNQNLLKLVKYCNISKICNTSTIKVRLRTITEKFSPGSAPLDWLLSLSLCSLPLAWPAPPQRGRPDYDP